MEKEPTQKELNEIFDRYLYFRGLGRSHNEAMDEAIEDLKAKGVICKKEDKKDSCKIWVEED
ncbi:MAG: hypothetical protein ACOC80_12445 [Petrotogales bacterium]